MWLPTSFIGLVICVENTPRLIAITHAEHDGNENAREVDDLGPHAGVYLLAHRDDPKHGGRSQLACASETGTA